MEAIVANAGEILARLRRDRFFNPTVPSSHRINYFADYTYEKSSICLSYIGDIRCHIEGSQVSMSNENLGEFIQQFKNNSIELMVKYKLVDSYEKANEIIGRFEHEYHDPDYFDEFKNYIEGTGNDVKSVLEAYTHPKLYIYGISSIFATLFVKPFVNDSKDIENTNILEEFALSNTLLHKNILYRDHLRKFLITYSDLKRVYDTGKSCIFNVEHNSISNIRGIKQYDSLGVIFDTLSEMVHIIRNSYNKCSYDVFQSIQTLYRQFCSQCRQRDTEMGIFHSINQYSQGRSIDNILHSILNDNNRPINRNDISDYAKILAVSIMRMALEGRGLYANQTFSFYEMGTNPNSATSNGRNRVYNRENIRRINNRIPTFIGEKLSFLERIPMESIGDFSQNRFRQTLRSYMQRLNNTLNQKKREFENSFETSLNTLRRIRPSQRIPETFTGKFDFIAQIDRSEESSSLMVVEKYHSLKFIKQKVDFVDYYMNLIDFYETTNNYFNDMNCLGIIIENYTSGRYYIRPITIDIP